MFGQSIDQQLHGNPNGDLQMRRIDASRLTEAPPAGPVRRRGFIDAEHSSERGGWIIASGARWYFVWRDNPAIRPGMIDGATVEFSIGTDRGRPVAVDVTPIRSGPAAPAGHGRLPLDCKSGER